jgi:hypothetical protein
MNKAKRAAALVGLTVAFAFPAGMAVASADSVYPAPDTHVTDNSGEVEAQTATQSTDAATAGRTLPVTGGDIIGLTLLGGGAFAAGTVLVRRTRRA